MRRVSSTGAVFSHSLFFTMENKGKKKKVFTSPLEAELLNVTFSYEGELKCSPRGDEEKKTEEAAAAGMKWKSFPRPPYVLQAITSSFY